MACAMADLGLPSQLHNIFTLERPADGMVWYSIVEFNVPLDTV